MRKPKPRNTEPQRSDVRETERERIPSYPFGHGLTETILMGKSRIGRRKFPSIDVWGE